MASPLVPQPMAPRNPNLIRPRAGLRTIQRYCEQMAQQERANANFHTVVAVDPDVLHMAAFPLENLAQGSMFHAWGPLRELSVKMGRAMQAHQVAERKALLETIFKEPEHHIPLLTTIALSTYIFQVRGPKQAFGGHAVLPPHQHEWERAVRKAQERAHAWQNSLTRRVDVDEVRAVLAKARASGSGPDALREQLFDQLPHAVNVLFPAQLSPDHGLVSMMNWALDGKVRPWAHFSHGVAFEAFCEQAVVPDRLQQLQDRIRADITGSRAFAGLDEAARQQRLVALDRTVQGDARVLAFLEAVRDQPPLVTLDDKTLPLRVILLTASARIWRVASEAGLAETCLRSPISYLSDGKFFEWAFAGWPKDQPHPLLRHLQEGMLSDWLRQLTVNTDARGAQTVDEQHLTWVGEWEGLMSYLSTLLNLASPMSSLGKVLDAEAGGELGSAEAIAAWLQNKILDAHNTLARLASQIGLAGLGTAGAAAAASAADGAAPPERTAAVPLANLPPLRLVRFAQVNQLLERIADPQLGDDTLRRALVHDVMHLSVSGSSEAAARLAAAYFQSLLISLVWFRLGRWDEARDVAEQAAAFILGRPADAATEQAQLPEVIDGQEALYLVASTVCATAKDLQALDVAKLALQVARQMEDQRADAPRPEALRLSAIGHALVVARQLLTPVPARAEAKLDLARWQLDTAFRRARQDFDTASWQAARQRAIALAQAGASLSGHSDYLLGYVLHQMHSAIALLYLLADAGTQDTVINPAQRTDMAALLAEFRALASHLGSGPAGGLVMVDTEVARALRQAVACTLQAHGQALEVPAREAAWPEPAADDPARSHFDQLRLTWLRAHAPGAQPAAGQRSPGR